MMIVSISISKGSSTHDFLVSVMINLKTSRAKQAAWQQNITNNA